MPRASLFGLVLAAALCAGLLAACSSPTIELTIQFPNVQSRRAVDQLRVTAVVPLARDFNGAALELVPCSALGRFAPTRRHGPAHPNGLEGLAEVLGPPQVQPFAEGDEAALEFPASTVATSRNPWGLIAVLVEALGDAIVDDGGAGHAERAPLLEACTCFRSQQGSSDDSALDNAVKSACPPVFSQEGVEPSVDRTLLFEPLVTPAFFPEPSGPLAIAGVRNGPIVPAPGARVRFRACVGPPKPDCYACQDDCGAVTDLSGVPVVFFGGGLSPESVIAISDAGGTVRAPLSLGMVESQVPIQVAVLGRAPSFHFQVTPVLAPSPYQLAADIPLGPELRAMAVLPGVGDRADRLVVLSEVGAASRIQVIDVAEGRVIESQDLAAERPLGILGFDAGRLGAGEPALAVASAGSDRALKLRVYGPASVSGLLELRQTLTTSCASGCPNVESCPLLGTAAVSMTTADLDLDQRADLLLGADDQLAVAMYTSRDAIAPGLFAERCRCGQAGYTAGALAAVDLGGDTPSGPESPGVGAIDLLFGGGGGHFLSYAQPGPEGYQIGCGMPAPLGSSQVSQDVRGAYLRCEGGLACGEYQDLILLAGGSGSPGSLLVVYGSGARLSLQVLDDEPERSRALSPATLSGRPPPKDPRAIEVGDVDQDGHLDLAALYGTSDAEIHLWLGDGQGSLAEVGGVAVTEGCSVLGRLALLDARGDGRPALVVICDPVSPSAHVRWFSR